MRAEAELSFSSHPEALPQIQSRKESRQVPDARRHLLLLLLLLGSAEMRVVEADGGGGASSSSAAGEASFHAGRIWCAFGGLLAVFDLFAGLVAAAGLLLVLFW